MKHKKFLRILFVSILSFSINVSGSVTTHEGVRNWERFYISRKNTPEFKRFAYRVMSLRSLKNELLATRTPPTSDTPWVEMQDNNRKVHLDIQLKSANRKISEKINGFDLTNYRFYKFAKGGVPFIALAGPWGPPIAVSLGAGANVAEEITRRDAVVPEFEVGGQDLAAILVGEHAMSLSGQGLGNYFKQAFKSEFEHSPDEDPGEIESVIVRAMRDEIGALKKDVETLMGGKSTKAQNEKSTINKEKLLDVAVAIANPSNLTTWNKKADEPTKCENGKKCDPEKMTSEHVEEAKRSLQELRIGWGYVYDSFSRFAGDDDPMLTQTLHKADQMVTAALKLEQLILDQVGPKVLTLGYLNFVVIAFSFEQERSGNQALAEVLQQISQQITDLHWATNRNFQDLNKRIYNLSRQIKAQGFILRSQLSALQQDIDQYGRSLQLGQERILEQLQKNLDYQVRKDFTECTSTGSYTPEKSQAKANRCFEMLRNLRENLDDSEHKNSVGLSHELDETSSKLVLLDNLSNRARNPLSLLRVLHLMNRMILHFDYYVTDEIKSSVIKPILNDAGMVQESFPLSGQAHDGFKSEFEVVLDRVESYLLKPTEINKTTMSRVEAIIRVVENQDEHISNTFNPALGIDQKRNPADPNFVIDVPSGWNICKERWDEQVALLAKNGIKRKPSPPDLTPRPWKLHPNNMKLSQRGSVFAQENIPKGWDKTLPNRIYWAVNEIDSYRGKKVSLRISACMDNPAFDPAKVKFSHGYDITKPIVIKTRFTIDVFERLNSKGDEKLVESIIIGHIEHSTQYSWKEPKFKFLKHSEGYQHISELLENYVSDFINPRVIAEAANNLDDIYSNLNYEREIFDALIAVDFAANPQVEGELRRLIIDGNLLPSLEHILNVYFDAKPNKAEMTIRTLEGGIKRARNEVKARLDSRANSFVEFLEVTNRICSKIGFGTCDSFAGL